ncbi:MAG: prephenate dehydrogenase [Bacteroidia bacterium]|nr:prephenate dehydrogenase [Bacteroidia bacterium]
MTITIVGLGLIGGSLALDLRANGFADRLIGADANPVHTAKALEMGLVDEIRSLESACAEADLVILAVPVSGILNLFPQVLDLINERGVVVDMGSAKGEIIRKIAGHPRRSRAVAAHPMAGTEFSGPEAAVSNLFHGKAAIICDRENSDPVAVHLVERLFKSMFMRIIYMDAREHDIHTAYVSHISHITSFVLALTVLDKEKSEANIFNLASGGFSSTVRLAKSSPRMWRDVYEQNSENILDVLNNYIEKMGLFRDLIAKGEYDQTYKLMEAANAIGPILKGIK